MERKKDRERERERMKGRERMGKELKWVEISGWIFTRYIIYYFINNTC